MVETTAVQQDDDPQGIGPGTVLGDRYRVLRLVGEGGMGRVFLAEDTREGTRVALKVLADDRPIPRAAERFTREANSISKIDHDNVVRILDVGHSPRGGLFYVMEFLEGEELADTLEREGPLPWERARGIALQVCGALQAAHEKGVVHRDLKLENCFLLQRDDDDEDFIKILDFGVAKLLAPDRDEGDRLTNTGATLGTPAYMAPELCRGKEIDHRVDVYALGVMIFEMLTGHVPFEGDSFLDVALQHMSDPPPPLTHYLPAEELPRGLEAVIVRALAKTREERFPTMASFARALRRVGEEEELPLGVPSGPIVVRGGTEPVLEATSAGPEPVSGRTIEVAGAPEPAGRTAPALDATASSEVGRSAPVVAARSSTVVVRSTSTDDEGQYSGPFTPTNTLVVMPDDEEPAGPPTRWSAWIMAIAAIGLVLGGAAWWSSSGSGKAGESADSPVDPRAPADSARASIEASPAPPPEPVAPQAGASGSAAEGASGSAAEVVESSTAEDPEAAETRERSATRVRKLSQAQLDRGFKAAESQVKACAGPLTGSQHGDRVQVKVRIDRATGEVVDARVRTPQINSAVRDCVLREVKAAEFASGGSGVQSTTRWFTL